MIKYLLEKEFKQLLRNPMLPRMLLVFPCIILLVLPWAAMLRYSRLCFRCSISRSRSAICLAACSELCFRSHRYRRSICIDPWLYQGEILRVGKLLGGLDPHCGSHPTPAESGHFSVAGRRRRDPEPEKCRNSIPCRTDCRQCRRRNP